MRRFSVTMMVALAVSPAAVGAQTSATPAPENPAAAAPVPSPAPAMSAATIKGAFHMFSEVQATQRAARAAMLGALTPAHRQLLSRLIGDLAVAPDPNIDAAAKQLDGVLSPAEVRAIGNAEAGARTQMVGAAGQMQSTLSPEQRRQMLEQGMQAVRAMSSSMAPAIAKAMQDENDPGHVLLKSVLSGLQPFSMLMRSQ
ncbi:MAG: hypothetical protein GIW94_04340 [Candidatus Eremiobacteraeota bacterium]|nr:hypothetical protein [Candidatus Eremiobacteraeota bacterium]MBC5821006.1 hypothetical protein [Candidatus Eremiobacteraeota bacterium]